MKPTTPLAARTFTLAVVLASGAAVGAMGPAERFRPGIATLRAQGDGRLEPTNLAEIRAVLNEYVNAVNAGDERKLRALWFQPDTASYVTPIQRLQSWGDVERFWKSFLQDAFTTRDLKPSNVSITAVENVAWAAFDWEFTAAQRDGKTHTSRGWETQIYRRTPQGWRIAHIHYSVPPPSTAPTSQ